MNLITKASFNKTMPNLVRHAVTGVNEWDAAPVLNPGTTSTPLENYTGLPAPNDANSRAALDWSSGVQVAGGAIGIFLNGYATPSGAHPTEPGKFMPYWSAAAYSNPAQSFNFAGGKTLHMALSMGLGHVFREGDSGGQIYTGMGFDVLGKHRELIILLWDSRNNAARSEYPASTDVFGTKFCGSYIGPGAKYVTSYGDSTIDGATGWRNRQFYYDITRQNMVNILAGWGETGVTPEQVKLKGVTYQCELFGPDTAQYKTAQFGAKFDNMIVANY